MIAVNDSVKFFPEWEKDTENSLVQVFVSRSAILHNFHEFKKCSQRIAPVLKSNAYGHGLLEVAQILENEIVPFIVLDSIDEATLLRKNSYKKPLLIIGYVAWQKMIDTALDGVAYTITSKEMLFDWCQNVHMRTRIHLKIDTGMCRQGIMAAELQNCLNTLQNFPMLEVEGICTHFSDADNDDESFTNMQISMWNDCVELCNDNCPSLKYFHVSNTAGHWHLSKIMSNVSRLGIGLYGLGGNGKIDSLVSLKPAMRMETKITGTKKIIKGSRIGYSGTFVAPADLRIATLPVGYGVGLDRRLSNKGFVKIEGQYASFLGRISMNIATVDITNISSAEYGTSVVVISDSETDINSVTSLAQICNTLPHEIVTGINPLFSRIIIA